MDDRPKRKARRSPWFKMWGEARSDVKLEILNDHMFRVWFRLLCKASESGGLVEGFKWIPLAYEVARGDLELLKATLSLLGDMDMAAWSDDRIAFLNFAKRNPTSPSNEAEARTQRTKEHREREMLRQSVTGTTMKRVSGEENNDGTTRNAFQDVKNDGNDHETRFSRHIELDQEEDPEQDPEREQEGDLREDAGASGALPIPTKTYPLSRFVDVEASPTALDEKTESSHEVPPAARGQVQKSEVGARFDRFWAAYPKKSAKPVAMRAFASARVTDDMLTLILADLGTRRVSREWLKDGGQFIPMASTYLNQRRWLDEGLDPAIADAPPVSSKRAASDAAIAGFLAMYETTETPKTIAAQVAEVDVF